MDYLDDKSLLITGGTGSFGKAFVRDVLETTRVARVIVFSRDELKQFEMQQAYAADGRVRFVIGNVRDAARLRRALDGVDVVIHSAALKQIATAENNPTEAVRTNIQGTENVIDAALDAGVERVIGLSTDKASSPVNLYGATKLVADKLLVAGNAFAARGGSRFSVVRYGNVMGSRGSVVQRFRSLGRDGRVPITDRRMTRFWITLRQGVDFVRESLVRMRGGEIFVPKLPSIRLVDLAEAIVPGAEFDIVGARPGEKLHEELISETDARHCLEMDSYYLIEPETHWWSGDKLAGESVADDFSFRSDSNDRWLGVEDLRAMLETACDS